MPKANRIKGKEGCTLTEDQVNRLLVVLEQIDGCAELLYEHCLSEGDNPAVTIYNVIKEKAKEADAIVMTAYSK